mgnify:CR=1 FL=1
MTDYFKPNAIRQTVASCDVDKLENAIKKIGIGFTCEYFGYDEDGPKAKELVNAMCVNAGILEPYEMENGEYFKLV